MKLLGRDAWFIAAGAAVANQDVNFTLIPEVPFKLDEKVAMDRDASGNIKLKDIGLLLRERVESYFKGANISVVVRYFDPNYLIRSSPANAADAILCDLLRAQRHARSRRRGHSLRDDMETSCQPFQGRAPFDPFRIAERAARHDRATDNQYQLPSLSDATRGMARLCDAGDHECIARAARHLGPIRCAAGGIAAVLPLRDDAF